MVRVGGAAEPGAALKRVGECGGLTALLVLGWVSFLLSSGNCKSQFSWGLIRVNSTGNCESLSPELFQLYWGGSGVAFV